MFQYEILNNFWSYAIKHVVFLINRVPSPVIKNQTPFELLFNQKPDFSIIKVFGSLYYASTYHPRKKFDLRSRRGIFLGFQNGTKGYIILDIDSREIFLSRNVIFHETILPFKKPNSLSPNITSHVPATPSTPFSQIVYPHMDPISLDILPNPPTSHFNPPAPTTPSSSNTSSPNTHPTSPSSSTTSNHIPICSSTPYIPPP